MSLPPCVTPSFNLVLLPPSTLCHSLLVSLPPSTLCHSLLQPCVTPSLCHSLLVSLPPSTLCHSLLQPCVTPSLCHSLLQPCVTPSFNLVSLPPSTLCHSLLQPCVTPSCSFTYLVSSTGWSSSHWVHGCGWLHVWLCEGPSGTPDSLEGLYSSPIVLFLTNDVPVNIFLLLFITKMITQHKVFYLCEYYYNKVQFTATW